MNTALSYIGTFLLISISCLIVVSLDSSVSAYQVITIGLLSTIISNQVVLNE